MVMKRSADHYRNVKGKRVLVHGHMYEAKDLDAAFDAAFGVDPVPPKAARLSQVDEDFDAAFGQPEPAPEPVTAAAPESTQAAAVEDSVASLTKDGDHLGYPGGATVSAHNGKLAYTGPFNMAVKNAIKHDVPGSKWSPLEKAWIVPLSSAKELDQILQDHLGKPIQAEVVKPEAVAAPQAEAFPKATPLPGDNVPYDQLQSGMVLINVDGDQTWKVTQKNSSGNMVFEIGDKSFAGSGLQPVSEKSWKNFEKHLFLMPPPSDKIGKFVPTSEVNIGMVVHAGNGEKNLIVATTKDTIIGQGPAGVLHSYPKITWDKVGEKVGIKLFSESPDDFKPGDTYLFHEGDTKLVDGVTFIFNKNHRWERIVLSPSAITSGTVPFKDLQVGMSLVDLDDGKVMKILGKGKTYVFADLDGEEHVYDKDEWIEEHQDGLELTGSAPQPDVKQTVKPPSLDTGITKIIQDLTPGGLHNQSSGTFINGLQIVRSKTFAGQLLYIKKKDSNGISISPDLKKTILAIPGAVENSLYMKPKNKWMQIPFDNASDLGEILEKSQAGILGKPKAVNYKIGDKVPFSGLKAGMTFGGEGLPTYTIVSKAAQSVQVDNGNGIIHKVTKKYWEYELLEGMTLTGKNGKVDVFSVAGHSVGETKVIQGKLYILNQNHRWELVNKPMASPSVASMPASSGSLEGLQHLKKVALNGPSDVFPFKQIGPQKGSNEGGLYQDSYGKKFYIKFPKTKDHVSNEILASKLYMLAGVQGPKLKMVKKDGVFGVASAFQEGLKIVGYGDLSGTPGTLSGFAADAWLGNWDVVGLDYDNLQVGPDGKAVRIDVGGALVYRAMGSKKTDDEFGNEVKDLDTLRNASKNSKSAAVFGKMTRAEIIQSLVPVLEIPDDMIQDVVAKYGPGSEADKAALAAKLIARKNDLAKKFPEADAIAHPPKPDPQHLPVKTEELPKVPDFMNWQGSGKAASSMEWVNKANTKACQDILDFAMKGDLVALKNYKFEAVDKGTGKELGLKSIEEHPSQHVQTFWGTCVKYMEVLANPGAKMKNYAALDDFSDILELSDAFPSKPWGVNPGNCNPHENLGYWMALGLISDPSSLIPPKAGRIVSAEESAKGFEDYKKWPPTLKAYISAVQATGNINHAFKGDADTYHGTDLKKALAEAYQYAAPKPPGTTVTRWMDCPPSMYKQLQQMPEGLVFQNTDSMCTSKASGWDKKPVFDGTHDYGFLLRIHYAEGAKAVDTYGSGSHGHEAEITTLPGQRFVLLKRFNAAGGKMGLELLMLPPDPTFLDSVSATKGKAG